MAQCAAPQALSRGEFGVERLVLRPLVNQSHLALFMATIGLAFFLEGLGEMIWGGDVRVLGRGAACGQPPPAGGPHAKEVAALEGLLQVVRRP